MDLWIILLLFRVHILKMCYSFVQDVFEGEITGKCSEFQTVPGCGLKCKISNIDSLLSQANKSETMINYNNQTQ